jgi:nucleotide-binding universal stress UspA family protein
MSILISRILLPVDFSSCSRASRELAAQVAEKFSASVDALHVWEPPSYIWAETMVHHVGLGPGGAPRPFDPTAPEERMEEFLMPLVRRRLHVRSLIEAGDPVRAILAVAARERHDLIVMGLHERGGIWDRLHGSVAESVVRQATCPVLTVQRPRAPVEDEIAVGGAEVVPALTSEGGA